jgi:hypothetical protein
MSIYLGKILPEHNIIEILINKLMIDSGVLSV